MPFNSSPNALNNLLRVCYRRPHVNCLFRNTYAAGLATSHGRESVTDVAVLGAGVSGLSTAYFLAKDYPKANITVFESSPRIGGWMQSTAVDIEKFTFDGKQVDGGQVVFEQGPRTLRTQGTAALTILYTIYLLGLDKDAVLTHRDAPAAQNRYIYYPDHLVCMPNPGSGALSYKHWDEPIFDGVGKGALMELFRPRGPLVADESISSFVSRRFSPQMADNLVSALMHGVYAGDVEKLSMRALLPTAWNMERMERSVIKGMAKALFQGFIPSNSRELRMLKTLEEYLPSDLESLRDISKASVFTLKGGLETLASAFKTAIEKESDKAKFRMNTYVESLSLASGGHSTGKDARDIALRIRPIRPPKSNIPTSSVRTFSHVISTLPAPALAKLLSPSTPRPSESLPRINYTTVQVVNLFYADPNILPVSGFGYLIPRSVSFNQNPEFALGVIFDSETSSALDTVPGTKLTVMLGGHWWDGWTAYPTPEDGISMAKSLLQRHLGIKAEPLAAKATIQRDCIPQYEVGHIDRVLAYSKRLSDFKGRVKATGNWVSGVGVNDCIMASLELVKQWDFNRTLGPQWEEAFTGPEQVWAGIESPRVLKRASK